MNVLVLAGMRLRALGYEPGPGFFGPWAAPPRLRSVERDLRRRGLHRDAAGIGALAEALETDSAAKREPDAVAARRLLCAALGLAADARDLLTRSP